MTVEPHPPLWVDTDGGIDDLLALALLAGCGRTPACVSTVAGNVPVTTATENVRGLLHLLDLDVPVVEGAPKPLVRPLRTETRVHGQAGRGRFEFHEKEAGAPALAAHRLPALSSCELVQQSLRLL